jgi:hypothetical protein
MILTLQLLSIAISIFLIFALIGIVLLATEKEEDENQGIIYISHAYLILAEEILINLYLELNLNAFFL